MRVSNVRRRGVQYISTLRLLYTATIYVQYVTVCLRHNLNYVSDLRQALPLSTMKITVTYANYITFATRPILEQTLLGPVS